MENQFGALEETQSSETDLDLLRKIKILEESVKQKPKKKSDVLMRTIVGFFVFAIYVNTYYSGILYQVLFAVYLFRQFTKEFSGVSRNKDKDKLTGQVATEFVFFLVVLFWTLPMSVFQHQSLYESGITRQKYPWIYLVFFDYHATFVIIMFSCWFIWMTVRIQPQHARF